MRIRKGRPASILPDQLAGGLMGYYQQQLNPEGRRHFFQLLTSAFGVQGNPLYTSWLTTQAYAPIFSMETLFECMLATSSPLLLRSHTSGMSVNCAISRPWFTCLSESG